MVLRRFDNPTAGRDDRVGLFEGLGQCIGFIASKGSFALFSKDRRNRPSGCLLNERVCIEEGPVEQAGKKCSGRTFAAAAEADKNDWRLHSEYPIMICMEDQRMPR